MYTEINEKDAKFAFQFYPLHQIGYLGSQLSETALHIMQVVKGSTIKEIAEKLNVSERTVYKHIRKLIELNLVSKVSDRYYRTTDMS